MNEKQLHTLKRWQEVESLSKILDPCDDSAIEILRLCALYIMNVNIPFSVIFLLPFEKRMKILCHAFTPTKKRDVKGYHQLVDQNC